ncbi:hybrid sensor histidine kinase/response regulator [Paucibacter soli]|uniref:hybrid sensor histidine kinase/response regulator n=1 Tax=Paucibacter soli TaxID=3133433 RepID=UPI003095227B
MSELGAYSMLELFRMELQSQAQVLTEGLLRLERQPDAADPLAACMRAAHSLKGAARIVGLDAGVTIAHQMEELLVAAQGGTRRLGQSEIDLLLRGLDLLQSLGALDELALAAWAQADHAQALAYQKAVQAAGSGTPDRTVVLPELEPITTVAAAAEARVLRVNAEQLRRMLSLAGEARVEARRMRSLGTGLQRLKRQQQALGRGLAELAQGLRTQGPASPELTRALLGMQQLLSESALTLAAQQQEQQALQQRSGDLARRLYEQALDCRMRPFADGVQNLPRMVRELARSLGKQVRLEILGSNTSVDRDLLEQLEAPLAHLLGNALDHGLELPEQRLACGKAAEGLVQVEARHVGGLLHISVSDDGAGIDLAALRRSIVRRGLSTEALASSMSEPELLEFLFLPGFSLREQLSQVSGRGVGLDAVQSLARRVGGNVRVSSTPKAGCRFLLQLPLALSVLRALRVRIGGAAYALPLSRLVCTARVASDRIAQLEGRSHVSLNGRAVGLLAANELLGGDAAPAASELPIVVLGTPAEPHGLIVDALEGECELVLQPLDARLGKLQDLAAAAVADDGAVLLVLDVDDLLRSIEKRLRMGELRQLADAGPAAQRARQRLLVVDDSLTVRELQRQLLEAAGYQVNTAVDGMDGWNMLRAGQFDLLLTDVDMPRLDGIELTRLVRRDAQLKQLPVLIVSYKDREEDRQRGLEAGADYYLTKGSFHDQSLLRAVADLIGVPA